MKLKLSKQYLLQQLVQRLITLWLRTILYFCLSVLWWLRMVLQCSFNNSSFLLQYWSTQSCLKILCDKTFSFLNLWFGNAVAGRLLKGYQESCWWYFIMFSTFGHFSCAKPALVLSFFFLCFSICALFMCVLAYCILLMDSTVA